MNKKMLLLGFLMLWGSSSYTQAIFTEVSEQAGINHDFQVFQGTFGGGATVLDYDLDGFEDVFLAGGVSQGRLYRNMGDGTFTDVTELAGLNAISTIVSQGAISADVNRDGYPDLFITTIASITQEVSEFTKASNLFFINQGNGTFSDQSVRYKITDDLSFSTGAAFGDFNKDGLLDLYVSNYFKDFNGQLDEYGGPIIGNTGGPGRDLLYINQGGIGFKEVSDQYGMTHTGFGFQGVWTDFDNDNDLDLMIANDFGDRATPNLLYRNNYPEESFTEVSESLGFDYAINAMGIGVGDINMDGWLDYFVSNISESPLLINQGIGKPFLNETRARGTGYSIITTDGGSGVAPVSWGANFFDADNDMDVDLFVNNGGLNPSSIPNPSLMLENNEGIFQNIGFFSGVNDHSFGRGSVVFDYDNDGDLDLLIINQAPFNGEQPDGFEAGSTKLYRNESAQKNWLKVKLNGKESGTNGIGSKVEVFVDGKILVREIHAGSSHESQNSLIAHFGLDIHDKIDSLRIHWSRGEQIIRDITANQLFEVEEDVVVTNVIPSGGSKNTSPIIAYPVPFHNELNVAMSQDSGENEDEIAYIVLTDLSGHKIIALKVLRSQLSGSGYLIRLNQYLAQGVYVLIIDVGNTSVKKKVYGLGSQ